MGRTLLALVAVGLGAAATVQAQATATRSVSVEDVAWLQGCWWLQRGDRRIEERWSEARGGTMISEAMTTREYQVIERETVVLSESDGRLVYTVHRRGQPTTTFLSRSVTRDEVVFENPVHDFPQRIGYRRKGTHELFAWIEGTAAGQQRRVEFPYRDGGCNVVR